MKSRKLIIWITFFSISIPFTIWCQTAELVDIQLSSDHNLVGLKLTMDTEVTKYKAVNRTEGNISITELVIEDATASKEFEIPLMRPILHTEVIPPAQDGTSPLRVRIYLEQKLDLEHNKEANLITVSYTWIQSSSSDEPVRLTGVTHSSNDEKSLTINFNFMPSPQDEQIFMTNDKKQIIGIFHNCNSEDSKIEDPSESELLSSFSKFAGESHSGAPFFKFIISSSQEMLFDKAREEDKIFLNIYGVGDEEYIDINARPPEDAMSEDFEGSSSAKWVYIGVGAAGVIGGGVAWYLLSSGEEDPKDPTDDGIIPEITDKVNPPEPTQ